MNKKIVLIFSLLSIFGLIVNLQSGAAELEQPIEEMTIEWEEAGIDLNHTDEIEKIRIYIDEYASDTFSSLHINREEKPLGVIVLSFTEEPPAEIKKGIDALVEDPTEISFRVVPYTEEELMDKQSEIDKAVFVEKIFQDKGISVYHTSTDILNNKVEIGISPFNEETVQEVRDYFGDELIQVVEGHEAQTLIEETESADEAKKGFFAKILSFFSSLFGR